jgi:hypothetical protein
LGRFLVTGGTAGHGQQKRRQQQAQVFFHKIPFFPDLCNYHSSPWYKIHEGILNFPDNFNYSQFRRNSFKIPSTHGHNRVLLYSHKTKTDPKVPFLFSSFLSLFFPGNAPPIRWGVLGLTGGLFHAMIEEKGGKLHETV